MQIGCETKKILEWYRMTDAQLKEIDDKAILIKEKLKPELLGIIRLINKLARVK